ncbi:MAG: prephenate dehydrogenase/arogenate dehydrogenase family protein, partial [SAR324 cluster bacterium]|nr:prephenate dehydrogenase/arogenate dehydrogenase family protein [SAR324 cluster bacterium]
LQALGSKLTYSSPEEHDKMMAVVQVLVHFNTIVMGETLRDSGISILDTLKFTSPIYKLELSLIGRLFAQDPTLYAEILFQNPYSKNMRELFLKTANKFSCLLDREDRDAFKEHFVFGKEYFNYFAEESMQLSDRIIEEVVTNRLLINDHH